MKQARFLAGVLALSALTTPALAQTGGAAPGALPVCSAEAVRQALAGDYAGPPCRFTEMPDQRVEAPVRDDSLRLAGAPPATRSVIEPLPLGNAPRLAAPQPVRATAPHPTRSDENRGEPVRLSDTFFHGNLVGGVGREPTVQFGYRGLIVIDGSGQTRLRTPGQMPRRPVHHMDARGRMQIVVSQP